MKRWLKRLAMGFLVLGLAACSNTADEKPGTDASKKTDITIGEVFEKSQANSEKLESMHANMDIKQKISAPDIGQEMDSTIKVNMDLIQEPLEMHQIMEIGMGNESTTKMEIYMTQAGFFMQDPESEVWGKMPTELYEELMAQTSGGANPTVDFAALEQYVDDFTFEQNNEEYILKLKASDDKFTELIQNQLGEFTGIGEEEIEVLEDMKVNKMDYEIYIDKETFDTTAFNMIMEMEVEQEGSKFQISQDISTEISAINELKEIKVPQEILDSAVEQ